MEEIVKNKDFEKSDTEVESYESIEELEFRQEYETGGIFLLDDLNEREMNDPRVQAMFKRSRQKNLSIFIISQDHYELPNELSAPTAISIFKPNNFRDVLCIYEDKSSMDKTLNAFELLTSTCWNEKYQPLTNDMTKDKHCDRYRLGLNS